MRAFLSIFQAKFLFYERVKSLHIEMGTPHLWAPKKNMIYFDDLQFNRSVFITNSHYDAMSNNSRYYGLSFIIGFIFSCTNLYLRASYRLNVDEPRIRTGFTFILFFGLAVSNFVSRAWICNCAFARRLSFLSNSFTIFLKSNLFIDMSSFN